ncbi:MAG TPA: hypothetical protein VM901_01815 [Bdellovibrionota bacterium]|jgi:tetratricopeptide (TPR) repeat protein|nr:hypothetical protein [Bdellovibrionota bacterium]
MNNQEIDEKVSVLKSILLKSFAVIGLLLVVSAAYMGYQSHLKAKNVDAANLLYQAIAMETQSVGVDPAQPQVFQAEKVLAWDTAKLGAYLKILSEIDEKYSGTPTWAVAQIRRAKIFAAQQNLGEAEKIYQTVLAKVSNSSLYFGMASDGYAVLLENQGKNEAANKIFHDAAAQLKNPLRPLAMLGEARTLGALGKSGASELLEKVVKEYPETSYSRRAKVLRSTLSLGAR